MVLLSMRLTAVAALLLAVVVSLTTAQQAQETASSSSSSSYGVDVSFPMHTTALSNHLPDRKRIYRDFVAGCRKHYGARHGERCDWNEEERMEMNLNQPKDMHNYTSAGFAKVSAPPEVTELLKEFWEEHKSNQKKEKWPKGNTYVNHWDTDTYFTEVSEELQEDIAALVQPVLEAWTDQSLVVTSIYGVRVYKEGAVLAPHVDRLPLVSSCILNVAQDVDEDWPLEVIGHDGVAVNVTAHPGDMIMYESHSVIHGRPFAMKGRFYANIFVHFEPYRYTEKHALRGSWGAEDADIEELEELYRQAEERSDHQHRGRRDDDIPHYVDEDKADQWGQEYVYHPDRRLPKGEALPNSNEPEGMSAHTAAALGKILLLEKMFERDPTLLTKPDANGWRPIHEAARGGETETLKYLVKKGADVNERTNDGRGATPLFWAEQMLDKDHEAIKYLKAQGAVNESPKRAGEKGAEL